MIWGSDAVPNGNISHLRWACFVYLKKIYKRLFISGIDTECWKTSTDIRTDSLEQGIQWYSKSLYKLLREGFTESNAFGNFRKFDSARWNRGKDRSRLILEMRAQSILRCDRAFRIGISTSFLYIQFSSWYLFRDLEIFLQRYISDTDAIFEKGLEGLLFA